MRFINLLMVSAAAAITFGSCKQAQPDPTPKDSKLVVSVSNVGEQTVDLSVKNDDPERTLFFGIHSKVDFDQYGDEQTLIRATISYLDQAAAFNKMTLEQLLRSELMKGDVKDYHFENMSPDTEYVAYAFGLSYDGVATTGVYTCNFKTQPVGTQECTFKLAVSEVTGTSCVLSVTPSNPATRYTCGIMTKSNYETYCGGSPDGVPEIVTMELEEYLANNEGVTLAEAIEEFSSFGNDLLLFDALDVNCDYVAYAIGIGINGTFTTAANVLEFKTESRSKNEFTVEIVKVTSTSATYNIVATLGLETFAYAVVPSSYLEGKSEKQIMDALLKDPRLATYSGTIQATTSKLDPETDYTVCVFGYAYGVSTTTLTTKAFKTKARESWTGDMFILSVYDITSCSASVKVEPKDEVAEIYYYFDILPESTYIAEGGNDEALKADMEKGIANYMNAKGVSRAEAIEAMVHTGIVGANTGAILKMETTYRFYVVGMYLDGTLCTSFQSTTFTTKGAPKFDIKVNFQENTYFVWFYPPDGVDSWYKLATAKDTYENMSEEELSNALLKTFKYTGGYHYSAYDTVSPYALGDEGLIYCYCMSYIDGVKGAVQHAIYDTKTGTWK